MTDKKKCLNCDKIFSLKNIFIPTGKGSFDYFYCQVCTRPVCSNCSLGGYMQDPDNEDITHNKKICPPCVNTGKSIDYISLPIPDRMISFGKLYFLIKEFKKIDPQTRETIIVFASTLFLLFLGLIGPCLPR